MTEAGAEEGRAQVVRRLWEAMQARQWDEAAALVAEDVVVEWPQSDERIRGRSAFLALNRAYPGEWSIEVLRVREAGPLVVAEVRALADGVAERAVSLARVEGGRVAHATEYWASEYPAPAWRAAWVEPLRAGKP